MIYIWKKKSAPFDNAAFSLSGGETERFCFAYMSAVMSTENLVKVK